MPGFIARRVDEAVRASARAMMDESGKQIGSQVKRAVDEAATQLGPRMRRAKRSAILGAGAAGAGMGGVMSVPQLVLLERDRRERRERRMAKSYDSLSDLAAVAKAWKGESGDRRNTKYYLAGVAGASAGGVASLAARPVRAGLHEHSRIIDNVVQRHLASGNPDVHRLMSDSAKGLKASPIVRRAKRVTMAGGLTGLAAGVGGYAALRNSDGMKRKRQARVAARRMQGELQATSKAMTPNKIAGLRRAASRPAGSGMARSPFDASGMRRYAQARLGMAGVGQGIRNPSVPNLRQSLRSQASQYRPGVSLGAGVSNNGRPAARLP